MGGRIRGGHMARIEEIEYLKDETQITIRVPEIKDAKGLIEHVKKINKESTFLIREEEEFNFTIKQQESFIRARVNSDINLFIIAEVEGKIIGSCILSGTNLKREKHKVDLNISIQKEYWGIGIGKRLIEISIGWAKENNIEKIGLKVDTSNSRAVGLYEKLGFEVEGRLLKDKYMSDGSYRNSYLMGLILN
jgi:RimJ/RimL family protein N-acetyltransferase